MTNKQIAAALRELALYAYEANFTHLPGRLCDAVEDFWWDEVASSQDERRMYMLFVAESLS